MATHPTCCASLLLLLILFESWCHGRPEIPEHLQSSDILKHVLLTPTTTSIHVSWEINDPGDGTAQEYRVRWEHKGIVRGNLYIDDAIETTISGLKPCTDYRVSVTAIDIAGKPSSESVFKETSTLNEAPPSVTGLQSQTSSPNTIILSWEKPATTCEVTSYRIHLSGVAKWGSHSTHNDVKTISSGVADIITRYELDGLLPYSDYSVDVVAYTAGGAGKNATTNFTTAEGEPSQPINLRTTKPTANSITATWDEPAEKNGVLSHYHISWYRDGSRIGSQTESHTAHTIAGLSPCVEYTIRVAASTAAGKGGYREITQRTDVGAPPQPHDTSCHLNTDKTVSVTWAKPETSCPIIGFKVYRPENSLEPNAMSTIDVLPSTLSVNFSLVYGLKFRVCVAAVASDTMIGPQACCEPPAPATPLSTPHPQATRTTKQAAHDNSNGDKNRSDAGVTKMVIAIAVGVVGIIVVAAVLGFVCWQKKNGRKQAPVPVAADESRMIEPKKTPNDQTTQAMV